MRFFSDLRSYRLAAFFTDLLAGLSIAFLVIPQAIAYAVLANLPFVSGLYSAIFGVFVMALFSRSPLLISGPSTAMAILVQTAIIRVQETSNGSVDIFEILSHLLLLIGAIHLLLSLCNISKCLQFVSRSVMLGYFTGVSVVICTEQLFYLLDLEKPIGMTTIFHKLVFLTTKIPMASYLSFFCGILGIFFLLFLRKKAPVLPAALLLLVSSSFCVYALPFLQTLPTLTKYSPISFAINMRIPQLRWELLQQVWPCAVAIAFLGILEVFSVAKALAMKTKDPVHCNQEVFSLGMANLCLSLFPFSMPACASITRSLLTQNLGGKTRVAALSSSIFVYLILLFFLPFAKYIPVVALTSLLLFSALHIVDLKALQLCFRATKEDAFIFLFTFFLCMVLRLDMAFITGIFFAIGLYLRSAATPHFQEYAFDYAGRLSIIQPNAKKHSKVRIIGIGGELFFGVVDVLENAIANIAKDQDVKVVVLRLNNVHYVDGSMCLAIVQLHEHLQSTGRYLIISGITEKVWHTLSRAKVLEKMHPTNFFLRDETRPQLSTWKACLRAEELLTGSNYIS